MENEKIDVVDQQDRVLKTIFRKDVDTSIITRAVNVYILNSNGKMILQLRADHCARYPSHWDCTCGGAVTSGQEYDEAAKRELEEEVGIKTKLTFLGKHYVELTDGRKHMSAFYKGTYDGETKVDPNEVEKVQTFSLDEIRDMIAQGEKFHPECLFGLKEYFLK